VVDVPDLNAYAIAGGNIFITRKMVAFLKTEDELAGIIGHELGHAIVRHQAIDYTKLFKEVLNVDKVGDRDDIFQKYNLFLEKQMTKSVRFSNNHEDKQQLEADSVGLYAMTATGYDPEAFATAWERLTETDRDKETSPVFFDNRPAEKRLREMVKAISSVSPQCISREKSGNEEFLKWQSLVVTTSSFAKAEKLSNVLLKKELDPYLRGDITHIKFSPDGNFVIAQDESGINIVKRDPFAFVFRIPAEDAKPAEFSPDSRSVVFQTYGLRVEKWSIAGRKPELAQEVFVRGNCWQSALSPDGKMLACIGQDASLRLIDVATNTDIVKKVGFYVPDFFEYLRWQIRLEESAKKEVEAFQMSFSPDGRYFLCGRVARVTDPFGFQPGETRKKFLVYDSIEKKELKVPDELKDIVVVPFAFLPDGRIIGQHRQDREKSGIFDFPSGKQVEKFYLAAESMTPAYSGNYLIVRPIRTNPAGIFDLKTKRFVGGNKTPAIDTYGNFAVSEDKDGMLGLFKITDDEKGHEQLSYIRLPKNDLGRIRSIAVSDDMRALALSETSRGGVWSVANGKQAILISGFRGAAFGDQFKVYADFPARDGQPRSRGVLDPLQNTAAKLDEISTPKTRQHGKFIVRMKGEKETDTKKDTNTPGEMDPDVKPPTNILDLIFSGGSLSDLFTTKRSTLEVYDSRDRKLLWSQTFGDEDPRYFLDTVGDRLILSWPAKADAVRAEAKKDPSLKTRLEALGSKRGDYFVRVVDAKSGSLVKDVLIETGKGSFIIERAQSSGTWLLVNDDENRVLAFSLATGELVHRFFGRNAALNPANDTILVENIPGKLTIYSLVDGKPVNELIFTKAISHAQFGDGGNKLFVLAADQTIYIFDAKALAAAKKSGP
jgi:WD40 repeat protein